ncbi:MAG: permease [Actinomycetota bacterium]|nr:permease [Actinomycetota bacterium]
MSTSVALRPPQARGAMTVGLVIAAAIVLVRITGAHDSPALETFVLILTSIVVEALPFVLLGALVSALIEVYVPERFLTRIAAMPVRRQLPLAALGGFAFPVCECGSVPVARRLIARGVHPAAGLAFMLASPILNPVVLASTVVAYAGRGLAWEMTLGRAGLGLLLAIAAGWALGTDDAKTLLRPRPDDRPMVNTVAQPMVRSVASSRRTAFVNHLAADFFFMGRFVVIGSALAAAMQTIIPQSIVAGIARTPIVGALALMAIAFVLSLCSEADAFVAVSFTQFPLGSQLAFLVFGPVVDAKLAFLYGATFRRRFVARLVVITVPIVLAGSLWFEALVVPR